MLQAVRLLTELARPAEHHHHHHHQNRDNEGTMETGQQSVAVGAEGSVQFREIYKNGWLRRTDKTDKETNRFWVTFCVHDDAEPRLEGFTDQKQATTHSPLWAHSLRGIQHLSPTLCATQRHDYEFCVNFSDDRVLRLAAPTYQGMLDWVQLVTRKLTEMKILRPKENLYSKGPERVATRDPTSPLPPPPLPMGSSTSQQSSPATTTTSNSPPDNITPSTSINSNNITIAPSASSTSSLGREVGTSVDTAPMVFTFDDISLEDRRTARPVQGQLQRNAPPTPSPRIVPAATTSEDTTGDSSYESIFMASSYSPTGESARIARDLAQSRDSGDSSNERYAALMEYRSSGGTADSRGQQQRAGLETRIGGEMRTDGEVRTGGEGRIGGESRTGSEARNGGEQRTVGEARTGGDTRTTSQPAASSNVRRLTLREQQVFQLRREMAHPAGVRLLLGRRDCKDSIAFVDTYGAVWVAGWKQREHPLLYNVLHVGDLVLSVAGTSPPTASTIKDILKGCSAPRVEVIVRRLPYARAITLTKRNDTEDFGLEVNGNEVSGISGVALSLGLTPLATATDPTAPPGSNTTWTLTEINGRPLNIFDGKVCERFRAVGRDISIVIQPTDLVSSLRKKLRAMRSFKNFVMY